MRRLHLTIWLLVAALAAAVPAAASTVRIENEYIAILAASGETNTGRFSINTTGGDPDRAGDENSTLIYGSTDPWTSFTTVYIDGEEYIFGGPTQKRAGKTGQFGNMLSAPAVVNGAIEAVGQTGPVKVRQGLSFAKSSTTGLPDTARILYELTNTDEIPHEVGLRIVLDTMLGANDGAPFRVNEQALTTDTVFFKSQMPSFWQAFDSLSDPKVMAQGTLRGDEVTTPDRAYFTNWGSLADSPWKPDFVSGRDFTRKGEFELDSAIALYYDPITIQPGEKRVIIAYYGLGGVTIRKGDLSLGVTSKASVVSDPKNPETFPIVAYIENTGKGEARDVKATISLPSQLKLVGSGEAVRSLGALPVGETVQVTWTARPSGSYTGEVNFKVRVESLNADPNEVTRTVKLVPPAKLDVTVTGPEGLRIEDNRLRPDPFPVVAKVQNNGGASAYLVYAKIDSPVGLKTADGDTDLKGFWTIPPGESIAVRWHLSPTGSSGRLPYSVTVTSRSAEPVVGNAYVPVPMVKPQVGIVTQAKDNYIKAEVRLYNVEDVRAVRLVILYEPGALSLVGGKLGVDKGSLLLSESKAPKGFRLLECDTAKGRIIIEAEGDFGAGPVSGDLLGLRFRRLEHVKTTLTIDSASLTNRKNQPVEVETSDAVLEAK